MKKIVFLVCVMCYAYSCNTKTNQSPNITDINGYWISNFDSDKYVDLIYISSKGFNIYSTEIGVIDNEYQLKNDSIIKINKELLSIEMIDNKTFSIVKSEKNDTFYRVDKGVYNLIFEMYNSTFKEVNTFTIE